MNIKDKYINHVKVCVEKSNNNLSKIEENSEILNVEGMSSGKVRHLLNNVCSIEEARYLEVGTWKGSTLLSALYNNLHVSATCIDDFSQFNGPKKEFLKNVEKFSSVNSIPNFEFIEKNCFLVDTKQINKKNIYFFDGGHEEEDHVKAFTHFNDALDDVFICAIDDWQHKKNNVKIGTQKAFKSLNYKVLFQQELLAQDGWWGGIYIAVVEK